MRNYTITELLGSGTFGSVFKGVHKFKPREIVAIKREPLNIQFPMLRQEAKIYQYLTNTLGIPTFYWFGIDNEYYYLVTELLGISLNKYISILNKINLNYIINIIGTRIINIIENVHNHYLVHRDLKPDNFLFEYTRETNNSNISNINPSKLFIIDFGFSTLYMDNTKHIQCTKTNGLIGSLNYASINAHKRITISRRDDLESIGYILLFLTNNILPWHNLSDETEIFNEKNKWVQWIISQRNISIIGQYFYIVRNLLYSETPNYNKLKALFNN
mgnify:CR=1 FL=1